MKGYGISNKFFDDLKGKGDTILGLACFFYIQVFADSFYFV